MKASAGNRVLMLLENNPYQLDKRPTREAHTLIAEGFKVTVISPMPPGGKFHSVVDNVSLYQYPAPPEGNGLLHYLWEYAYSLCLIFGISIIAFLREGFDILHAHCPPDMIAIIAAPYKLIGKRFVYDHHDLAPEMYRARFRGSARSVVYRSLLFFEKLCLRLADHVIATNESYKSMEMVRGGVPSSRITIVRNGPDHELMHQVEPDVVLRLRADTIIGYAGRMGPQDGVDYLLRALDYLVHDFGRRDIYCVIIGNGDMLSELKALAAQLSLDESIWFTGWISEEELVRYLSTADICVDPDPSNPFNDRSTMIKMMEYMALGKPIVAFDLPEHRVTAQDSALYARPNDELDFARQILLLMNDSERRATMGRVGRDRIERKLAWVHQEPCLIEAYKALSQNR